MNFVVLHRLKIVQLLNVRIILICAVVLSSVGVHGQPSPERQALTNIEKGKWEKAFNQLNKAFSKDTLNVAAAYVMGIYFFAADNPEFQLDSAYYYATKALRDLQFSSAKQRERLRRFPLDSATMVGLRHDIDSAAFERAKQFDTEKSYIDFITNFPTASQQAMAISLRNKAAYHNATVENNLKAFNDFITKYPDAEQVTEATLKYHEFLFLDLTKDKHLSSYKAYLKKYPRSLHAPEAERNIFEIMTADGSIDSYIEFLRQYPSGKFSPRANGILFHLLNEQQREEIYSEEQNSDSLNAVLNLTRGYLVPFLHERRFGFMNQQGIEVINTKAEEIEKRYLCGNLSDDVIALPDKLVAINGATIYNQPVEEFDDLGHGFLLIEADTCSLVLHKTGFALGDKCVDNAKVLGGKFIAIQKNSKWSLWTFTGRMLLPFGWDEINAIKDVIVLKTNNKYTIATTKSIAGLADQNDLGLTEFVDEVRSWRGDNVWLRSGTRQGILTQKLDTIVRLKEQVLTPAYFGAISKHNNLFHTWNEAGDTSRYFKQVIAQEPWTAVRQDSSWFLFDPATNYYNSPAYDSIFFAGPSAIGLRKDSIRVYFSKDKFIDTAQPVRVEFVPGQESFLLLQQGTKKTVYNPEGKKLVVLNYDNVHYAGEGYFVVTKKDKKGLVGSTGKVMLPLEYDAIGTVSNARVSLLKGTKFGLFDCKTRKLIKPQYTKNLTCYNNNHIIAEKDGMVGFIGWDNKPLSKSQFNEVRFWNDSAALVRNGSNWMVYAMKAQKPVLEKINKINFITDGDEKLAIIQQERRFGVIHNKRGTIIPINFSDIINVGSSDTPMYFTEKHVEEASLFVVIYYDAKGNMLRKEVYEQDDYEKIYCTNN